jgi:hypothetical protein
MIHLSKILPLVLLIALTACASDAVRVTKMDLLRNSYEITPLVPWVSFQENDAALKQQITQASAGLCGAAGIEILDVERPAYIRVPMTPRGYLHCR